MKSIKLLEEINERKINGTRDGQDCDSSGDEKLLERIHQKMGKADQLALETPLKSKKKMK